MAGVSNYLNESPLLKDFQNTMPPTGPNESPLHEGDAATTAMSNRPMQVLNMIISKSLDIYTKVAPSGSKIQASSKILLFAKKYP